MCEKPLAVLIQQTASQRAKVSLNGELQIQTCDSRAQKPLWVSLTHFCLGLDHVSHFKDWAAKLF